MWIKNKKILNNIIINNNKQYINKDRNPAILYQ